MVSGLRNLTFALFRLAFTSAPHFLLNLARPRNSPVHSSIGTPSTLLLSGLRLLVGIRFQVLFHSPPGVLFTVPSRYSSLSVHISISPWRVVPPASHKVPRAPWYSGFYPTRFVAPTGLSPSSAQVPTCFGFLRSCLGSPLPRLGFPLRFGLRPVRSPLLGVSRLITFPRAT